MRTVGDVLDRLAAVDTERLELIATLREMGFRSRGLVGEYGELLAAAVYPDSRRAAPSQPGYDLVVRGLGLVQVKTLRSTPTNHRTSMGVMQDPYDVLVAIRLDVGYRPSGCTGDTAARRRSRVSPRKTDVADGEAPRTTGVREIDRPLLDAAAVAVARGQADLT